MNADHLLALYERISEAPDAIASLRRFVRELAVRGKLVKQASRDEPASELLKQIAADKADRSMTVRSKRSVLQKDLSGDGLPYKIPANWVWVALGDVTISRDGERIPVSREERDRRTKVYDYYGASGIIDKIDGYLFDKPLLLIGEDGANLINRSTPIAFIARGKYWVNNHAHVLDGLSEDFLRYIELFISATDLTPYVTGTAQPKMNQAKMNTIPVAIPPLAEQQRIVAKVDELMALCDQLEAARTAREATRDRLTTASLTRLTAPDADAETFRSHARFALDVLPALTTRPDQIKTLRQTILNLAVCGKLMEQDPADEPASELLKLISEEMRQQLESRKIRQPRQALEISEADLIVDLPSKWEHLPLGNVTIITDPNPSHRYPEYSEGTVPLLSTQDFSGESGWNASNAKLTTEAFWEFQKEICEFESKDIVFARKGRLGLPRFLPPFERFTFSHTLFVIKPMTGMLPEYLLMFLKRDAAVAWLMNEMNQNTGVPTLGKAKTERLPITLPPLAEQHRILAKVDELMALCDRLEAILATADTTRRRLLKALLHEALESAGVALEAAE